MPVPKRSIPTPGSCHLRLLGLPLFLLLAVTPLLAKTDQPLRIPLEPLGYQQLSSEFLLAGSSMLTLHYVDDRHLLITFTVHRLLSRLPDEPEDDLDRHVDAVLLELPTGHILARTSWRLHDHGQYLWSLGHGRFLLRIRDNFTTFAPLINLPTGEPFHESPFLTTDHRRIAAVLLSPDANLLVVETVKRTPPVPRPKTPLFGPTPPPAPPDESADPTPVQINFYRLSAASDANAEIRPRAAGVVRSRAAGNIATTTAGYLVILEEGRQHWAFDFNSYVGKTTELAPFDSTCRPSPYLVSGSEFIALGCRSGNAKQVVGGFNMRGDEMWEQNLFGDYIAPSFVFAPSSGRFVLSRILVRSSAVADQPFSSDEISGQSIVVYQTGSGKQILRAECSPVERAGQNFALSPNGLGLALVHADAIEVYNLPPLTTKEQADVKLAEASAPPENDAPVHFAGAQQSSSDSDIESATQPPVPSSPSAADNLSSNGPQAVSPDSSATVSADPQPVTSSAPDGDPSPGQPRKPPTLYTLPTDQPHSPPPDDQPK
jgi:hypothetical protein